MSILQLHHSKGKGATSVVSLDTNSITLFLQVDATSVVRLDINFAVTLF